MVGFGTTRPSIDEARFSAFQTLIRNKLPDLNVALARQGLNTVGVGTSCVIIGNPLRFPSTSVQNYPVIFAVSGADDPDNLDVEMQQVFIDSGIFDGIRSEFYTLIYIFPNPDLFRDNDIIRQAENRERYLSRCCDFIRADVFNHRSNRIIQLESTEYDDTEGDSLSMCHLYSITKKDFDRGIGANLQIRGAVAVHYSLIQ